MRSDDDGIYEDYLIALSPKLSIRLVLLDIRYNMDYENGTILGRK